MWPDCKSLWTLHRIDRKREGTSDFLSSCPEDRWLETVWKSGSDTSHEVVVFVVPDLNLSKLDDWIFEHFLNIGFSRPFKVCSTSLVHCRENWKFSELRGWQCKCVSEKNLLKLVSLTLKEDVNVIFEAILSWCGTFRDTFPIKQVFMHQGLQECIVYFTKATLIFRGTVSKKAMNVALTVQSACDFLLECFLLFYQINNFFFDFLAEFEDLVNSSLRLIDFFTCSSLC